MDSFFELILIGLFILFSIFSSIGKKKKQQQTGENLPQAKPDRTETDDFQEADILKELEALFKSQESQSSQPNLPERNSQNKGEFREKEYRSSESTMKTSDFREYVPKESTAKSATYQLTEEDKTIFEEQQKMFDKFNEIQDSDYTHYFEDINKDKAPKFNKTVSSIRGKFKDSNTMKDAIILSEILNKRKSGRRVF
ncbi:MAG: hypothetical protein IAE91_09060 [Ignavibacteriaceae bacterium]|nr:hypothetical protein [Ignavibacteriaceae bacterium]